MRAREVMRWGLKLGKKGSVIALEHYSVVGGRLGFSYCMTDDRWDETAHKGICMPDRQTMACAAMQ